MPDLPRPAGEKEQGAPFVTHESMGRSLGSQKKVLGRVIGVEKRLGNAEKKITIMKNIMKMRKSSDNIGNTIKGIAESVESIAETTTEQYDLEKDKAEDARLAGEKDDAKKDEKNLEKGWGSFKSGAEKVLKPVTSLFEKLANFVKTFLLGGAVLSLMEWFGNPENTGKIQTLFRFFKDWWPILVTGLILFVGTILGPGALWIAGIALVAAAIPSIINGVKSIFGMGKDIDKDLDDKKGEKLAQEGVDGVEKGSSSEMQESQNKVDDMKNLQEPQQFNKGGPVPGKGDKDTVPAMLTPGEFVMSKGAVQKYGSDTLAGMNAAAGGTNMPTMGRYSGGGKATGPDKSHFGTEGYRMGQVLPEQLYYNFDKYTSSYKTKDGEVVEDKDELIELSGAIGMPDLIEHQTQLVDSLRRVKGYEDINFMDVVQYPDGGGRLVGMPEEKLYPIFNASDAWKASDAKRSEAIRIDMESGTQFLDPRETAKMVGLNGGGFVPIQGFQGGGAVRRLGSRALNFVKNKLQSPPPPPSRSGSGSGIQINVPAVTGGAAASAPQATGSSIPAFSVVAGGGMAKEQTLGIRR